MSSLSLVRQGRALRASPQLIQQQRKILRLCVRCGERPPAEAETSCTQCLHEVQQLRVLQELESTREAAAARIQARATRPTRTIRVDGREFVVAWDGTH
jgi:ribosomal protein L40E